MLRVAIIGASGYTGGELVRLLSTHPDVTVTAATSRQHEGKPLSSIYPHLHQRTDLICTNPTSAQLAELADFFFCAVPHQAAMALVPGLIEAGRKVVDLSADFRFRDIAVYEHWYQTHSAPELAATAVYGLPELYRERIRPANLVGNPGCYPTGIILTLAPLLHAGVIDTRSIIIDAKSGTSGAGRSASIATLFCEINDGFRAYKVAGQHRHTPEIEQHLSDSAGHPVTVTFTPHLLPISRGILSTIYATLTTDADEDQLRELLHQRYHNEPFVRVLDRGEQPATQYVRGSNHCDIALTIEERTNRVILTAAIDNLVKGAAGQAVQNMNLMCGYDETAGLTQVPLFP
ncbi:N-acetyl-gamma-glutamyl-phosphate reductase [Desulfofustis glycolicus]|uniref:N-acetyl-gamma-glutamyl-phosphate reductase n=1 Tax=Desulfofustis glycolicus DSM 9705 TaxID=1121409 RepID=A0A1M5VUU8_9BACT|nr:N-acetyl-gamma-glutamyl-phosphate reductase [Desulfobulbaceae bacterium]SHH78754.1 N-acetyl-gamma-glutamyl-phosphate reductase [Desulfofustis glycolicus DSM 9705]